MDILNGFLNAIGEFGAPLAKEEALLAGYGHAYADPEEYFEEDEDDAGTVEVGVIMENGEVISLDTMINRYNDMADAAENFLDENDFLRSQVSSATIWNVGLAGALVVVGLTWLLTSVN